MYAIMDAAGSVKVPQSNEKKSQIQHIIRIFWVNYFTACINSGMWLSDRENPGLHKEKSIDYAYWRNFTP
ncbi:hypothetical protein GCM10023143_05040 [Compostibacter hankyongensis]|uniref:Uncharacterized protein n=1 Tax=Compostibacter hankyongensis TaxID=1007089 RepID=A0ABP8FFK8_9BACT